MKASPTTHEKSGTFKVPSDFNHPFFTLTSIFGKKRKYITEHHGSDLKVISSDGSVSFEIDNYDLWIANNPGKDILDVISKPINSIFIYTLWSMLNEQGRTGNINFVPTTMLDRAFEKDTKRYSKTGTEYLYHSPSRALALNDFMNTLNHLRINSGDAVIRFAHFCNNIVKIEKWMYDTGSKYVLFPNAVLKYAATTRKAARTVLTIAQYIYSMIRINKKYGFKKQLTVETIFERCDLEYVVKQRSYDSMLNILDAIREAHPNFEYSINETRTPIFEHIVEMSATPLFTKHFTVKDKPARIHAVNPIPADPDQIPVQVKVSVPIVAIKTQEQIDTEAYEAWKVSAELERKAALNGYDIEQNMERVLA